MNIFRHHIDRHRRAWIACALTLITLVVVEVVPCNLPFWTSFGASTDSSSALNPIGPGLRRQSDGTLTVTDPTAAFMEVTADRSSQFVRIEAANPSAHRATASAETVDKLTGLTFVHVRLDSDGVSAAPQSVDTQVPHSLYLRSPNHGANLRLWIQEPRGATVAISAVRANVSVPFRFNVWRFAAMATLVLLLFLFRPNSTLWNVRLNPHSRLQRLAFTGFMITNALAALMVVIPSMRTSSTGAFHEPGGYTYDFNQYGHLADALIRGHTWLDLPEPTALANCPNPYDPSAREAMLAKGANPIYWDYAYRSGHWYSYFGVLPAIAMFVPYRLISGLFVPGGLMLSAEAATALLLFIFVTFGSLLIIRVISSVAPRTSLAATVMALALFLLGSNTAYLCFRMNFYSIPFASSLAVSALGLWFWTGATMPHNRHTVTIGDAPALSWPHLAAGSCLIAANVGCRPTFALVSLLAFALFSPQLAELRRWVSMRQFERKAVWITLCSILIPAALVLLPLAWYNFARFGSPLDFGERYQITVADMTHHHSSVANLLPSVGYYLFLPLKSSSDFPFLAINPTPLERWNYTEPMVGGLITLCPALLLCVLLVLPRVRRRMGHPAITRMIITMPFIGLALLIFDSLKGGIAWRYMIDFGWLMAISTSCVLASMAPCDMARTADTIQIESTSEHGRPFGMPDRLRVNCGLRYALRAFLVLLVLVSLITTLLCVFVSGREDAMPRTNPALYQAVSSWFKL